MALFGRKKQDRAAAVSDAEKVLLPGLTEVVDRVRVPCAALRPGGRAPASANASYVAGHPYLPDGADWPTYADRPMFFLCQVNFAGVPDLPDFPTSGLLQWFVGADGPWGLTFDETAGRAGFAVRWYADPSAPSVQPPTAPTPWHELRRVHAPIDFTGATALIITAGHTLPAYPELSRDPERDRLVAAWAQAKGEEPEDVEFVWDEYVRGISGPFPKLVTGSNLGGTASFTQDDPRGSGNYPAADRPEGKLMIEIDSAEFGGWGDAGIAHLFGDPAAVARGDQSSLRYHWDCC